MTCFRTVASLKVAAGVHSLKSTATGQQVVEVETVKISTSFSDTVNDIAVLKLKTPINFGNTVQPVCLAGEDEKIPDNTEGIVTGWGMTKGTRIKHKAPAY